MTKLAIVWSLPTTQGWLRLKILTTSNKGVYMTTEVIKKEESEAKEATFVP